MDISRDEQPFALFVAGTWGDSPKRRNEMQVPEVPDVLLLMGRANRNRKKNAIMQDERVGQSFEQEESAAVLSRSPYSFSPLDVFCSTVRVVMSPRRLRAQQTGFPKRHLATVLPRAGAQCALFLSLVDHDLVVRYEARPRLTGAFHRRYESR